MQRHLRLHGTALLTPSSGAGTDVLTLSSMRARAARIAHLASLSAVNMAMSQEEIEAARWVYAYGAPAGRGTRVKPDLDMTLQPLETTDGVVAVLALKGVAKETMASPGFRRLIGSICRLVGAGRGAHAAQARGRERAGAVADRRPALGPAVLHLPRFRHAAGVHHRLGLEPAVLRQDLFLRRGAGAAHHHPLEEAERLSRFVKNVLQMTRLEYGALVPRLQWADVADLIATALDAAHRRLQNHSIYADVADMLPLVNVDFVLMETVLVNLLDNAAKYAPPETDIHVVARRMGEEVAIEIRDPGRGIASKELGDDLRQVLPHPATRPHSFRGRGFGLAICKGIIEAHGGTIEALSEGLGHGTTIRLRLPVKIAGTRSHCRGLSEYEDLK